MPFGLLLDLWECHRQYNGIAKPKREITIDDVIPFGVWFLLNIDKLCDTIKETKLDYSMKIRWENEITFWTMAWWKSIDT